MDRTASSIALYSRLVLLAVGMSCLSPGGPGASARTPALVSVLASLEGELRIVIQKSRNVLTIYKGMTPVKSYWAAFGKGHEKGDKQRVGDRRTPEGEFYICSMNHSKRFYKFMGLSYPSMRHADEAWKQGRITYSEYLAIWRALWERRQPPWDTELGGAIGIHGRILTAAVTSVPKPMNWTDGCIALNNEDVDELFAVAALGTPVTIIP